MKLLAYARQADLAIFRTLPDGRFSRDCDFILSIRNRYNVGGLMIIAVSRLAGNIDCIRSLFPHTLMIPQLSGPTEILEFIFISSFTQRVTFEASGERVWIDTILIII